MNLDRHQVYPYLYSWEAFLGHLNDSPDRPNAQCPPPYILYELQRICCTQVRSNTVMTLSCAQSQDGIRDKTTSSVNGTGTIDLKHTMDSHNLAKIVYVSSQFIYAKINFAGQQSITTRFSETFRRYHSHQVLRIPRRCLATMSNIPACQALGMALTHLQNATGVTRTPKWPGY